MANRQRRALPTTEGNLVAEGFVPGPWEYFASTRVARARYDKDHQLIQLDWVDGGLSYLYEGVPANVWRNLLRSASPGKFVDRVLNTYNYYPFTGVVE